MQLHSFTALSKKRKTKRLGRGSGSGWGKTSGRGHKGAGQRKGSKRYIGHEGGNVPYLRKIPKRGFRPKRKKEFQVVNLGAVAQRLKGQKIIGLQELTKANLIKSGKVPVKVLAKIEKDFSLAATFKAHKFSRKATQLIEKAGGKIECIAERGGKESA